MGMKNDLMLEFLRDDDRFADMFNGGLFAGEGVVNATELEEASENYTEDRRENKRGKRKKNKQKASSSTATRSRDVKKRLQSGTELHILAIEEQSEIDYTMPWRCMNYDVLEYGRQVRKRQRRNQRNQSYRTKHERMCRFLKKDRLTPIFTICLYLGEERWDGPRTLREMMDFGSDEERTRWENQFFDYGMRLICVNELEDVTPFNTELKALFAIMMYRSDKEGLERFLAEHEEEYQQLDEETADVIGVVMGVENFMKDKEKFKEEDGYNMCKAFREMLEDRMSQGKVVGKAEGKKEGKAEGKAEAVIGVLDVRGQVPDELKAHIMSEKDLDKLNAWVKLAARAESIEDFKQQIGA